MAAPHSSADTPVMRQFLEIKTRYPDAILMFRMGDFYEMFFEDAVQVAPLLDIALTSRDKDSADPVPMAGVPYHALSGYLRTLVQRGLKVAICEQMETPEEAKKRRGSKIVRREVVRVVTPGALVDDDHLQAQEPNYLAAIALPGAVAGAVTGGVAFAAGCAIALCDISAGDFVLIEAADEDTARAELVRFAPKEILVEESLHAWVERAVAPDRPRLDGQFVPDPAVARRVETLAEESGLGTLAEAAQRAAAAVLGYAEATQPGRTLLLHRLRRHEPREHLVLDEASIRNLELFRTLRDGQRRGSLLWAIDATKTAMGSRLLRGWLGAPSRNLQVIGERHDAVEALLLEPRLREQLQARLRDVRDVIRLAARARLGTVNPRELGALRSSLQALPDIEAALQELAGRRMDRAVPKLLSLGDDRLEDVRADLEHLLVDDPPALQREGGFIRSGADAALDEQRALRDGGREALAEIELRERARTDIPNLKVLYNRVFGYFIEVPKAQSKRVPKDYVRKQTVANAERYVTEELAGHEARVLGAEAQALSREQELFGQLRERISHQAERLCALGERLATLDVLAGFAAVAQDHDYTRPELSDDSVLEIEQGRHPVVERMLESGRFVPNDTHLDAHPDAAPVNGEPVPRLWLITGPNMGGKSTVMRQTALISILAHLGSFVPARRACIGLVDRVFTRVGAADDLGRGESTFMVEMRETAQILTQATSRSLVLLDEIGRGTATYDGLSLAWAITEHLHDQIGCRAMFATHYHELCALEQSLPGIRNVHVTVHEQRGKILFLHQIEPGPAGRSYGIAVGRLAGLPPRVLRRADGILARLEASAHARNSPQLDLFAPATPTVTAQPAAGEGAWTAIAEALADIDPDELSPRAAHDLVRKWVGLVQRAGQKD